jgi:hypothetical protein
MKIIYSRNPDTTASYCPFSLLKKGKMGTNFLDANLIQVAPECRDIGGLPTCNVAILAIMHAFRSDKVVCKKIC